MAWYSGRKRGVRKKYSVSVVNSKGNIVMPCVEQYSTKKEATKAAKKYYIPGKRYAVVKETISKNAIV